MSKESLEKIVLETVDIPSIPPIAGKVLQLMNNDNTSVNELEKLISSDQSFSTRILKIANSPYYGRGKKVESIDTAIILIGFNTMKSLVVSASLKDLSRNFGLFEQKLWEHSLGVSLTCGILADISRMASPDEAKMVGLMHDMGKTVINNSLVEQYALVIEKVYSEGMPFIKAEDEIIGFNHCIVGGLLARKWKLPPTIEAVIEYHHADTYPTFDDSGYEVLCQLTKVADAICLHLSIGIKRPISLEEIDLESLGIAKNKIDSIFERVSKEFASFKASMMV